MQALEPHLLETTLFAGAPLSPVPEGSEKLHGTADGTPSSSSVEDKLTQCILEGLQGGDCFPLDDTYVTPPIRLKRAV